MYIVTNYKYNLCFMHYNRLLFLYSITEITPGKAVILLSDCGFNFKSNWNRFSSILNVPVELKEKMRAIIKEDETYDYAIEIALDWWIKNTSEASWKELISSVDMCGEKDTADSMKKKLSEEGNYNLLPYIHCKMKCNYTLW